MRPGPFLNMAFVMLLALVTGTAWAASPAVTEELAGASSADPALFRTGDEDTTIYLFGTVHFLDEGRVWFDDAVLDAFSSSDRLVVEMVAPDAETMQSVILARGIDFEGPALSETLDPETWEALSSQLEEFGMPAAGLEPMDPWFAAITLSALQFVKLGYSPEAGVESVLQEAAAEAGMSVSGLETFEEQIDLFDGLPEEDQIAFLTQGIEQLDEAEELIERMMTAWAAGDIDALAALVQESFDDASLRKRLLDDRNRNWAVAIRKMLEEPGTFFVAVGAGHLGGEGSVQEALSAHGIEVERVRD